MFQSPTVLLRRSTFSVSRPSKILSCEISSTAVHYSFLPAWLLDHSPAQASMDSSAASTPPPQAQPPPEKDHANLRVTYLITGNPRPPHSLGNVHLNTTVAALKAKIQSELPEHPSPSEQRLIYQGRPLLRNDASLRDVLRIEVSCQQYLRIITILTPASFQPGNEPGPLPYTIHIVVQTPQAAPQHQPSTNLLLNPPAPAPLPSTHPPHPDVNNPFSAAETSANRLQESLVRIQQQIEANRADLRTVQQRIALQHTHLGVPPNAAQMNINGQPVPTLPPQNFAMNIQFGHPFDQQQNLQRHPPRGPLQFRPPHPMAAPPVSNGAIALNPHQHNVQEVQGPNGQRVTVVTESMNFRMPMQRPSSAPGQRSSTPSQQQTGIPAQAPPNQPAAPLPFAPPPAVNWFSPLTAQPMGLPGPFPQMRPNLPQPSNATAWLLSSQAGPQALLFAPGHGYFSSISPLAGQHQHASNLTHPQSQTATVESAATPQPAQADNQGGHDPDRAMIRADQPQPAAMQAQAAQNGEDNDLFAFMINRGWLFLRLYLFMFVFSEPGTWKRWLMIIAAAVICLQPRNGPVTRLMTAARRHFDNLVGPPAQQPRPEAAAQRQAAPPDQPRAASPQNLAPGQRPANVRGAVQMTPEEAAARLVQERHERQDRQPRFWRDAFYRVEQSIALFLASLIPGVGERHVRAREETRREEQRREEQRRQAEEEAAAERQNTSDERAHPDEAEDLSTTTPKPEVGPGGREQQSASSSVQVSGGDTSGELRNRS